jgi:hypothetical protein
LVDLPLVDAIQDEGHVHLLGRSLAFFLLVVLCPGGAVAQCFPSLDAGIEFALLLLETAFDDASTDVLLLVRLHEQLIDLIA